MNEIEKMTLECLMNKSTYSKYLSQTNPKKYEEQQIFKRNVRKYKNKILELTKKYVENPDIQINTEMNEMFLYFGKTFIKYYKMKEMENWDNETGKNGEEDDEILFDEKKMEDNSDLERESSGENEDNSLEKNMIEETEDASIVGTVNSNYPLLKKKLKYTMDYYMRR